MKIKENNDTGKATAAASLKDVTMAPGCKVPILDFDWPMHQWAILVVSLGEKGKKVRKELHSLLLDVPVSAAHQASWGSSQGRMTSANIS